jgi:hypothetical protein
VDRLILDVAVVTAVAVVDVLWSDVVDTLVAGVWDGTQYEETVGELIDVQTKRVQVAV